MFAETTGPVSRIRRLSGPSVVLSPFMPWLAALPTERIRAGWTESSNVNFGTLRTRCQPAA
jgi:hypothetical protein